MFVFKKRIITQKNRKDEEIVLPETTKRVQNQEFINRTSYTKAATAPVEKPAETK